jgi:enoyl-CoA hydratase
MSQQHFETFDLTIENDIAHICLNRPEKRNSMIPSFWEDLPTAVRDIDDNAKARVIVISSSGPVFTAGMDLNAFTPKDHSSAGRGQARAHSPRRCVLRYGTQDPRSL